MLDFKQLPNGSKKKEGQNLPNSKVTVIICTKKRNNRQTCR